MLSGKTLSWYILSGIKIYHGIYHQGEHLSWNIISGEKKLYTCLYCQGENSIMGGGGTEFSTCSIQVITKTRAPRSTGIYILAIPPRGGGKFLSKVKNREEFEGGLEKRKGKGEKRRKKEKSDKTHVKIPL